jgi:hypothetical protein
MNLMNNDTLNKLKEYIDITSINLLYTSKNNYNNFKNLFNSLIKNQIKFINKYNFNKNIINLFGGIQKFYLFPILKWKEQFLGGTGYIDNIYPYDLNSSIMIGIDCYTRPFVTVRTKRNNNIESVIVLFQRYSDDTKTWTHSNINYANWICEGGYFLSKNKIQHKLLKDNINNLLNNKKINVQDINENIKEIDLVLI